MCGIPVPVASKSFVSVRATCIITVPQPEEERELCGAATNANGSQVNCMCVCVWVCVRASCHRICHKGTKGRKAVNIYASVAVRFVRHIQQNEA